MANMISSNVQANEIVKAEDFNNAFDAVIGNVAKMAETIFECEHDFVIGGKITKVPGSWTVNISPIFGVCVDTGIPFCNTERTLNVSLNPGNTTGGGKYGIIEIRGEYETFNNQQRAFNDPETDIVTYQYVDTQKKLTANFQSSFSNAGVVIAPEKTNGWVKLAEIYVPAGANSIDDCTIYNITADVVGDENSGWTNDKSATYDVGYISDLNERFRNQHNEDGSHKSAVIGKSNLKIGVNSDELNGNVLPTGKAITVDKTSKSATDSLSSLVELCAERITALFADYMNKGGKYNFNGEVSISSVFNTTSNVLTNAIKIGASGNGSAYLKIGNTVVLNITADGKLQTSGYTATANNDIVTKKVTDAINTTIENFKQEFNTFVASIDDMYEYMNDILSRFTISDCVIQAISTTNVTLKALQTIDGVSLAAGDLVLLKDQTNKAQNGIWEVQTGAWNRSENCDSADFYRHKYFTTERGTANKGIFFYCPNRLQTYESGETQLVFKQSDVAIEKIAGKIPMRDENGKIKSDLTGNADTATKVNNKISINGKEFDGSEAIDVGTMKVAHGGTGATTAKGAEYNILGSVETVETELTDNRYIALKNETVSASNGTFRWTNVLSVWNYIKGKISSVLGLTATAYNGNSATATQSDYSRQGAYCSTAAATAAKVANMRGFVLQIGATFPITFATANSANSALTLNINSTGAKALYINGAASSTSNKTLPAGTYLCRYDGTNYYVDTNYFVTNSRNATNASYAGTLGTSSAGYTKSSLDTALSGKVPTTRKVNGHALSADVTVSKSDVGLGSVANAGQDTTPTTDSTNYVTSGGVKAAISTAEANAKNLANATGTLAIAHGGTGKSTAADAANNFINALSTEDSDPQDNDYYVAQYAGGGTSTTTFHRRPISKLWNYIKSKISVTSSGTGNAITSLSFSNGVFTATKGSTFLTSHQSVKQDGVTGATVNRFGTCSTAAATAAKTVAITTGTFSLEAGARVSVKFSNANTANSPTLNVADKGAKNIFHKGAQITTGNNKALLAGVCDFIYDGTQWHLVGNYIDTSTTYSAATQSAAGLMSAADKTKLDGIASGAQVNTVTGVKGNSESSYRTGNVNITPANIGLGNVNNTADSNKNVASAAKASRLINSNFAIQTGSTKVTRITLQTLMTWLITTKKYIPSNESCSVVLQTSWSYVDNDILQFTANGTNYELQLAGVIIEFMGYATDYQTGMFRLRIHSSPTISISAASGYVVFPVSHIAEYTCNGKDYSPIWKVMFDKSDNYAGSSSAGGAANSVKSKLSIKLNGGTATEFDGSAAKSIDITPSGIGAAASSHTHNYAGSSSAGGAATSAAKLGTARTIDGVSFDGSAAIVHYGTCATAHNTAAKTVNCTSFSLVTGAVINVKFSYANTVASPTLNVNSTGAKAIYIDGQAAQPGSIVANRMYRFVYDGTYWQMENPQNLKDTHTYRALTTLMGTTTVSIVMSMVKAIAAYADNPYMALGLGDYLDLPSMSVESATYTYPSAANNATGGSKQFTARTIATTNNATRIRISGFNTYYNTCGGNTTKHILFEFENCAFASEMNPSGLNYYGFEKSYLYKVLNGVFLNVLKSVLGITPLSIKKYYEYNASSYPANSCGIFTGAIFLPTETEVFGFRTFSQSIYGNSYPQWAVYKNRPELRVKKYNGNNYYPWLASPSASSADSYCYVNGSGNAINGDAGGEDMGVAPAFCIG